MLSINNHGSSFQKLKDAFLKCSILCYPDINLPFFVMTNTSFVASGAVLMQKDGNMDLHPYAYYSKIFALAEWGYDIYDHELLTIIHTLEEWHQYLGTKHSVTIIMNHQNLTYFKFPQNLSQRQARWSMFMEDYDLIWDNCSGSQMGPADALSCCNEVDTSLDNTAITMLFTVSDVLICALNVELANKIAHFTVTNSLVKDATDTMSKHTSLFLCMACKDWTFLDGQNQLARIWYASCTASQQEDMVVISTLFT